MKKIVLILMALTIISKVTGFGREITLSYFFGASYISDAYLISITIPTVIFAFIAISLKTTFIPIHSGLLHKEGLNKANEFTNHVVWYLLIICTIIVLFVLNFTEFTISLFASGFEGETLSLAKQLTRISIFSIYFIGVNYIFEAYLQIKKSFIIPALVGIPLNIIIILSINLGYELDYKMLGYGQIFGAASQLLLLIPFAIKHGYKTIFVFNLKDENLKKMIYLSLPVILGTSVDQINKLVDRTIASRIMEGGISSLVYANRLNLFIIGIFVLTISTVLYPQISKMASDQNIQGLKNSTSKSLIAICLLLIPVTVGSMIFAEPIVNLLYGRGAFSEENVKLTANVLLFYTVGMLGFGFREILSKVFFSLQDTRTPAFNAALGVILNIILNIILSRYLGINGLALASSIAAIFTACLLFYKLRKRIGSFGIKAIFIAFLKVLIASLLMGISSFICYKFLLTYLNDSISLIASIIIAVLIYLIIISFMKLSEVDQLVRELKNKFHFRKSI